MAFPIPLLAPVTMATFPSNSNNFLVLMLFF
jgi:hypothetical protein